MIDSNIERDRVKYTDEDKRIERKGFVELTGRGSTKVIGNVIVIEDSGLLSSGTVIRNGKNVVKIVQPLEL